MNGRITRIDPEKPSASKGSKTFIRVYFELRAGDDESKWAKTDLDPRFRNFKRWKHLLVEGNMLAGLTMKNAVTVDADSLPRLAKEEKLPPPPPTTESSEQVIFKTKGTHGDLWLQLDSVDGVNQDTYSVWNSPEYATRFPNAAAASKAADRLGLKNDKNMTWTLHRAAKVTK